MIQHHKWSLTEVENMLPWERDIYVDKLVNFIKNENQRVKEQQRKNG
jgi:DNA replication initiation complex subunit (GINS family)